MHNSGNLVSAPFLRILQNSFNLRKQHGSGPSPNYSLNIFLANIIKGFNDGQQQNSTNDQMHLNHNIFFSLLEY